MQNGVEEQEFVVNNGFLNKNKNKKLYPTWNKDKVFILSLYILKPIYGLIHGLRKGEASRAQGMG